MNDERCMACRGKIDQWHYRPHYCFTCGFWMEKGNNFLKNELAIVTPDYIHFTIGPEKRPGPSDFKGSAGAKYYIIFFDGRETPRLVVSENIWYQGEIPEHLRWKFSPNAVLVSSRPMRLAEDDGGTVWMRNDHFEKISNRIGSGR